LELSLLRQSRCWNCRFCASHIIGIVASVPVTLLELSLLCQSYYWNCCFCASHTIGIVASVPVILLELLLLRQSCYFAFRVLYGIIILLCSDTVPLSINGDFLIKPKILVFHGFSSVFKHWDSTTLCRISRRPERQNKVHVEVK
jgi:hypothetical protein